MNKLKISVILLISTALVIMGTVKNCFAIENTDTNVSVAGTIEIPKTDIKYPIIRKLTKKNLELGVVVIFGAGINQEGNTVIIGHNYRNNMYFSQNKTLQNGDEIYITGTDNVKEKYVVYNKFEASPEDTSFYDINTNGEKVITLSSCTDDAKNRVIIQAKSEEVVGEEKINKFDNSEDVVGLDTQSNNDLENANTNENGEEYKEDENNETTQQQSIENKAKSYKLKTSLFFMAITLLF